MVSNIVGDDNNIHFFTPDTYQMIDNMQKFSKTVKVDILSDNPAKYRYYGRRAF